MSTSALGSVAILAGGFATRLHPLTQSLAKSMLPINGKPFIAYQLDSLAAQHITHVVLCVGYLSEQIKHFVGDGKRFGLKVEYVDDGDVPLDTAGALKRALPLLSPVFFVLYGDTYLQCDFHAAQQYFIQHQTLAMMTLFKNENQWDKSNVHYDGKNILAYDKKNLTPHMQHIDYGLGLFRQAAFDTLPDNTPYDLATRYQELLQAGELLGYEMKHRFYEVGSLAGIEDTRRLLTS